MTDRPTRPTRPRRDAVLPPIRVTQDQRQRWMAAAKRAGLSLSAWLRGLADAAAGPTGENRQAPRKKNKAPT